MPNFIAFISYAVMICVSPGAATITAMTNAGQNGFKKGLRYCFGTYIGAMLLMSICAVFTTVLYEAMPMVTPVLRYVGGAYILWMAVVIVLDRPPKEKKKSFKINTIYAGLLIQFANPQAVLFGFTNFATFILPYYQSPVVIAGFVLFLATIGFWAVIAWAVFGSVFQKLFETHRKLMNAIMALLLIYCAVTILIS